MWRPKTLADFSGEYRVVGDEMNYRECPVCSSNKWKLYVNSLTGLWHCFAGSHGAGGVVEVGAFTQEAKQELLRLLDGAAPRTYDWPEVELPPWKPLSDEAQAYLCNRGVQRSTCGALGIREMSISPRILVPYTGPRGRLIHWTGRAYQETASGVSKYMNARGAKPPFVLPRWGVLEEAVLVEGPFDAIAVWQATGIPTIALGGKTMSRAVEQNIRSLVKGRVWVFLDGDAQVAAVRIKEQLMDKYTCSLVMLDGRVDPADLEPAEIRERVV